MPDLFEFAAAFWDAPPLLGPIYVNLSTLVPTEPPSMVNYNQGVLFPRVPSSCFQLKILSLQYGRPLPPRSFSGG